MSAENSKESSEKVSPYEPFTGEHWIERWVWNAMIGFLLVGLIGVIIGLVVLQIMILLKD